MSSRYKSLGASAMSFYPARNYTPPPRPTSKNPSKSKSLQQLSESRALWTEHNSAECTVRIHLESRGTRFAANEDAPRPSESRACHLPERDLSMLARGRKIRILRAIMYVKLSRVSVRLSFHTLLRLPPSLSASS